MLLPIMKAESLKWKRTFIPKLIWLTPIVTLLLVAGLMGGSYFSAGAYNWWYSMLLPGALTICCALVVEKDAKLKYQSVLVMPIDPKRIWLGKILTCGACLFLITVIFFVGVTAGGFFFGSNLSLLNSATGSVIIFLTFLWQIPLCLFLAAKWGTYMAVLINLVGNIVGVVAFADGDLWCVFPYSILPRLICPILGILPNGLLVPEGSSLLDTSVIAPGLLITLVLFVVISFLTARWFQKREAN